MKINNKERDQINPIIKLLYVYLQQKKSFHQITIIQYKLQRNKFPHKT
jgi:hypothetical protein